MARWVLECPSCNKEFTQSQIGTNLKLADYYIVPKPDFPTDGLQLECPNCKKASLFQRHELMVSKLASPARQDICWV